MSARNTQRPSRGRTLSIRTPERARASTWAGTVPARLKSSRSPRGSSAVSEPFAVRATSALAEGRRKVSEATRALEAARKLCNDKSQAELIERSLYLLQTALKDLWDEMNAHTRGEWDTIETQRVKLSTDEKNALDFVLRTAHGGGASYPVASRALTDDVSRKKSTPAFGPRAGRRGRSSFGSCNSQNFHRSSTPDRTRSASGRHTRGRRHSSSSSRQRSASPAGDYLRRQDITGCVESLMWTNAENLLIRRVTPGINRWLRHANSWDQFDVWQYTAEAEGYPLSRLFLHYMHQHDLFEACHINKNAFINYIRLLEEGYLEVPYHNKIHATDVLHAMHFMLRGRVLAPICERYPHLRLAAYWAAAAHDYRHPGTNNEFAKNTQSDMAIRYNDISILENMHVAEAFKLLIQGPRCNFLQCAPTGVRRLVRRLVINMILHTDMSKHNDLIQQLDRSITGKRETKSRWLDQTDSEKLLKEAELLLCMATHCSDLANACRPRHIMKKWTRRVITEFWNQGDLERKRGLQVGPGRDRATANVPLGQHFFIKVLVSPLYQKWAEVVPEARICLHYMQENLRHWKREADTQRLGAGGQSEWSRVKPKPTPTPSVTQEARGKQSSGQQGEVEQATSESQMPQSGSKVVHCGGTGHQTSERQESAQRLPATGLKDDAKRISKRYAALTIR